MKIFSLAQLARDARSIVACCHCARIKRKRQDVRCAVISALVAALHRRAIARDTSATPTSSGQLGERCIHEVAIVS